MSLEGEQYKFRQSTFCQDDDEMQEEGDLPPLHLPQRPHIIQPKKRHTTISYAEPNMAGPDDETALSYKRNTKDELCTNYAYKCFPSSHNGLVSTVDKGGDFNETSNALDESDESTCSSKSDRMPQEVYADDILNGEYREMNIRKPDPPVRQAEISPWSCCSFFF